MTTIENEPSVITTAVDVKDDKIAAEDKPETTVVESPPVTAPEPMNVEKPKRAGRRKKQSDIPLDETNPATIQDDGIDTQPLFEQPVVLEGKRSRKPTSRLELSELIPPKKELSIPLGRGKPLGEIEYINHQITHASTDALSRMRSICFGRRGSQVNIRKNLRAFSGFEFARDSDEYQRVLSNLTKLKKDQLRSMSDILGLPASGRNTEHAERILDFLIEPIDEGKRVPEKKMSVRQSTAKKRGESLKETITTDDDEGEDRLHVENGEENENDDDDEEEEEEEEDDEEEMDEDYMGETGVKIKEDPDDYGYKPGKSSKKIVKKKSTTRRASTRRVASTKRKRGASIAPSKRISKKSKSSTDENVEETKENEIESVTVEESITPKETNEETNGKVAEMNDAESSQPKDANVSVEKDDSREIVNKVVKEIDTPMNNGVKDMISTTS